MHILRPAFDWGRDGALDFAASRGFGLVVASDRASPRGSHLPFTLHHDGETARVRFHVTAGNPLAKLADGRPFMIAVWGADAYVSNDWYATPDHVSTWLYEAVHLAGPAHRLTREANRDHGDVLLATFEERLEPKPPWQLATMEPVKREAMLDGIVVIEMAVETVEGQRKLNQHKSDDDYRAVADRLARADDVGSRAIAAKMRALKPHLFPAAEADGNGPAQPSAEHRQTRTHQW